MVFIYFPGKSIGSIISYILASFTAQNCHLLITQPIPFGPRPVLQANLSNKINFCLLIVTSIMTYTQHMRTMM